MENKYKQKVWQRVLASVVMFFLAAEVMHAPILMAATNFTLIESAREELQASAEVERFSVVAILVEEGVMSSTTTYEGLASKYQSINVRTLADRVRDYALDVQQSQPYTKSMIIPVSRDQDVTDIANGLERIYFEGDGTPGQLNKLSGIVLVGDVPLPVVNKNGNRFPSLLPYTDFEDKIYIFDPTSDEYLAGTEVTNPKAEVWHGVIKPPLTGEDGNKLLAEYFDKNHLYHCNSTSCAADALEFQQFSKKLFYMDLLNEFKLMDKPGFGNYLRFLDNIEALTYNRYNKYLLGRFVQESEKQVAAGDGKDNDGDGLIDEDPVNGIDDDGDGEAGSPLHGMADGIDNDNDGETDEDDEARFGLCDLVPGVPNKIKDCSIPGLPLKDGDFYNVRTDALYKVADNLDNDGDGIVDNGIDEDNGDLFEGIDNDWDGLIDEDTTFDNDADGDGLVDEDGPGDENGDGCSGVCGVDEDGDSYDFDRDKYPNGYENDYGSLIGGINHPTDPNSRFDRPLNLTGFPFLRVTPIPDSSEWIDEEPAEDDDEDGQVDEDGTLDNDNDGDGKVDEDPKSGGGVDAAALNQMPDSATKELVDQKASDFRSLFDKFFAHINDWTDYTGRYDPSYSVKVGTDTVYFSDVANVPTYITLKDEDTRFYLKRVNDAVENRIDRIVEKRDANGEFSDPQLQEPVPMVHLTTLWTKVIDEADNEYTGPSYEFINHTEYQNKGYINGKPMTQLKSVEDCNLYRGSLGVPGSNSILVETNHLYNGFDTSTNAGYKGCISDNMEFPERCFVDAAVLPIADPLGVKEVTGAISPDELNNDACYDFKEKLRFYDYLVEVDEYLAKLATYDNDEAKKTVPLPGSAYLPLEEVVLLDLTTDPITPKPVKITLADLVQRWGQVDKVDNNSNGTVDEMAEGDPLLGYGYDPSENKRISLEILKGGFMPPPFDKLPALATYKFMGAPLLFPEVKEVHLNIVSTFEQNQLGNPVKISSVTKHKEPTEETLILNSEMGKTPQSMPMDSPRYITFTDKNEKYHTVKYPNLFAVGSVSEARSILEAKEKELMKIAADNGISEQDLKIEGTLTSIIDSQLDIYADAPTNKVIAAADKVRLADAFNWMGMNIDLKHNYIIKKFLNHESDTYVGETPYGYESLYFVSEGEADTAYMTFNGDTEEEEDMSFKSGEMQMDPPPTEPGGAPKSDAAQAYQKEAEDGIIIWEWFKKTLKWVDDTLSVKSKYSVAPACNVSDGAGDLYDQLLAAGDLDGDGIPDDEDANPVSIDADGDGIPDGAENTARLGVTASSQVLKAGTAESISVTVKALSAAGEMQASDSFTQVRLILDFPTENIRATVSPSTARPLANGTAEFKLLPTEYAGTFTVSAVSTNRPELVSNYVVLESTYKKINLVTYVRSADTVYSRGDSTGFIIKDRGDTIIAHVDPLTGMVTITDDRFRLEALPAYGNKPTRLAVTEISTSIIFASVFFIANEELPIIVDDPGFDYFSEYLALSGVHVSDKNMDDNFKVEVVSESAQFNAGNVYLNYIGGGSASRVGILDRLGNLYLSPDYLLRLKEPKKSSDPVIFEVLDNEGNVLIELYIAASFPKVEIIVPEGDYDEFNLAGKFSARFAWLNELGNGFLKIANAAVIIPDTDNDGLNDLEEILLKLDLKNPDTDGDSYKDESELLENFNPAVAGGTLFSDLTKTSEGFGAIINLFRRNVLVGFVDGTFKPDRLITREEFVKLNLGAVCIQCTNFNEKIKKALDQVYSPTPFPDTNFTEELYYCVKEAKNRQIVSGYKGDPNRGFYLPVNSISRAEATKVILETGRQEVPDLVIFEKYPLDGKPWYYNYVLTAQKLKLYPKGRFLEVDTLAPAEFKVWYDAEINKSASAFTNWIEGFITRREFAMMVFNYIELHDCMTDDADGDGLPDNYEKYLFATSPNDPDTDKGGVTDFNEVINGTDPLNGADDFGLPIDTSGDDSDNDGLTNAREEEIGSNPYNPDTDGCGVNDGDEVLLMGIDPLECSDDDFAGTEGGFIVGDTVFENFVYEVKEVSGEVEGEFLEYIDEIPADGESKLFLKASILDENGNTDITDSFSEVSFFAKDGTGEFATIEPPTLRVNEGVAEVTVVSKIKAGIVEATAEITGKSIPTDNKKVYVVPQEPVQIVMTPESPIIRSGGLSTTNLHVEVLDENGNVVNNNLSLLTFKVSGAGTLDGSLDENTGVDGIQISTLDGYFDLVVTSAAEPGNITIEASVTVDDFDINTFEVIGEEGDAVAEEVGTGDGAGDVNEAGEDDGAGAGTGNGDGAGAVGSAEPSAGPDVSASATIQTRDDIKLSLTVDSPEILSDFAALAVLDLVVLDDNNNVVANFQGDADFKLMDDKFGALKDSGENKIVNGRSSALFQASNLAGKAVISATSSGFDPVTATVTTLPKEAVKIVLESDSDIMESDQSEIIEIKGKLYDTDGNFVYNDSDTGVTFQLTDISKKQAAFSGLQFVQANQGVVTAYLRGTGLSGPVNVYATSTDLLTGTLSLESRSRFTADDIKEVAPRVLFASLLGSDFGNIFKEDYFGGWLIFGGNSTDISKTQAAISLLSSPKPYGRLLNIMPNGRVDNYDNQRIKINVVAHNGGNQPNKLIVSDLANRKDLAEVFLFSKVQTRASIAAREDNVDDLNEGIYVQQIIDSDDYSPVQSESGVSILKNANRVLELSNNGNITVFDNEISVTYDETSAKYLRLIVSDSSNEFVKITYNLDLFADVNVLDPKAVVDLNISNYDPGVYVQMLGQVKDISNEISYSGNSTALPKGIFIVDKGIELPGNQRPGLNYTSLEQSDEVEGVGFYGDNKHMLLFSAGNSVGESNLTYSSEIGVVLGDPTVRINNKSSASSSGFTDDLGQEIFTGSETVVDLSIVDYNGDGLEDVLVSYENGQVRLLQNNKGYPKYEDKGVLLDFPNGIISMTAHDFNQDGLEDLVVATADSCRQGEVCVDLYENKGGNYARQRLNLQSFTAKNRIFQVTSYDVNNDTYPELITSDDTGAIRIFYNTNGEISQYGKLIGSLGIKIDPTKNLKTEVLVAYDGSPVNSPSPADDIHFTEFNVPVGGHNLSPMEVVSVSNIIGSADDSTFISADLQPKIVKRDFVYLDLDTNLGLKSTKQAVDLTAPSNVTARDDIVEYTIIISNDDTNDLANVMFADVIPGNVELNYESISCLECASDFEIVESGMSAYPYIYKIGNLAVNEFRTLKYQVKVVSTPTVKIFAGQNLNSGYAVDEYADIGASPSGNPTGRMTYFYSAGLDPGTGQVLYAQYTTPPPSPLQQQQTGPVDTSNLAMDTNQDGIPDEIQNYQAQQPANKFSSQAEEDIHKFGDRLEATIAALTCSSGCLPLPINFAFLAPGPINVMGVAGGFDPGLPVFGFGVPSLPPFWPPSPYQGSFGGRIYLSPTLTGSLATGICIGPYLMGQCWAFKVSDLIPSEMCDEIAGDINSAIATANAVIQGVNESAISEDGSINNADASGRTKTGGFEGSASLGNYEYKADIQTNFRIPGFPSVLTNWMDRQTEEVINKLTDGPDLYFIYPDPTSMVGVVVPTEEGQQTADGKVKPAHELPEAKKWTDFKDVLSYINSIPLIQIEGRDVLFKIPSLTKREIEKLRRDAQQWIEDERAEVNRVLALWCGPTYQLDKDWKPLPTPPGWINENETFCKKLVVDMTKLRRDVEKNIEVLQKYEDLPKRILEWRSMVSKYAYQLICYLDAIIKYTGGYVHKQQARIDAWIEMIRKIKATIADWKAIIELSIDYQASCDRCSSARFTLLELILKLFVVIPEPPIIPFPKLPDLYIDVSQIQTGIKIVWPDVRFRPEPIILPKLPRIRLPDIPTLTIDLPGIPILPDPPELPELPDLPPLPLPTLPDIPPPPKVPNFPVSIKITISILKEIMRILCLIKKGLVPVPETLLKPHIEQLTERPLSPLLPIDLGLNFQLPAIQYDYLDRIEVTTYLNLSLDFDPLYNVVKAVADEANNITTNIVREINKTLKQTSRALEEELSPPQEDVFGGDKTIEAATYEQLLANNNITSLYSINPRLGGSVDLLLNSYDALERDAARYAELAESYKDYHLVASNTYLYNDDAVLNRNIADIKANIKDNYPADLDYQKRVVALRDALMDYADIQESINESLNNNGDLDHYGTMLAEAPVISDYLISDDSAYENERMLAATNASSLQPTAAEITQKYFENQTLKEYGITMKKEISRDLKYFAEYSIPDVPVTPGMEEQRVSNKGIFIVNQQTQSSERLLNYTYEADLESKIAFTDMDNDTDNDILFSYGGNIYLKENYKSHPTKVYYGDPPTVEDLERFLPSAPSVNGFRSNYSNNKSVEMSWYPAGGTDVSGYELEYMFSPDGFDQELGQMTNKVGLVIEDPDISTDVSLSGDDGLEVERIWKPYMVAENFTDNVYFDGYKRSIAIENAENVTLLPSRWVHSLSDSRVEIYTDGVMQGSLTLAVNSIFELPPGFTDAVEMNVVKGIVEIIDPEVFEEKQQLLNGMMLNYDDFVYTEAGGSGTVRLLDGSYFSLTDKSSILLQKLETPQTPVANLTLPNGFYYAKVYSINQTGSRSTASTMALMAPSICADNQAPFPNAGAIERNVSIFKKLEIDAGKSFDTQGNILGYWIDTDLDIDDDKEGDPTNDRNLGNDLDVNSDFDGDGLPANDLDDPMFILGPYEDLTQRKVKLNVMDEALNTAGQDITINVFVPGISINESTADEGIIRGGVDPVDSEIPVSIMRDREGAIDKIVTASADNYGKYFTNADGEFVVEDLKLDDSLIIKNADGEVIGEINPDTGRIVLYNDNYSLEVLPAELPLLPTRVAVKDPKGEIILTIFLVPDINTDTTIDPSNFPYNEGTVALFKGVHNKDSDTLDEFEFRKIPTDDSNYPGSTEIIEKGTDKRAALLDTGGNFYIFDNRLSLRLAEATSIDDPLIINIIFTPIGGGEERVLGQFYIAIHSDKGVQFVSADKFRIFVEGVKGKGPLYDSDGDGMPDQWELVYGFNPNDAADAQEDADGDGLTNLEEYRTLSNPLNPDTDGDGFSDAEELIYGQNPLEKASSPFADVTIDHPYYDSILNLNQRNILKGIPTGNQLLFGPNEAITRAEFAKIMLDIFCIVPRLAAYKEPALFTDIPYDPTNLPWNYAITKEANFQGFVTGYLGEIDPVTGKTPFRPDNPITRAEAVKVILEALEREQVIDMGEVPTVSPWYVPYMEIAQDLTPYLKKKAYVRSVYVVTEAESKNPDQPVSRAEFIAMADRVLTFFDCSVIDDDGDGMPTFWENQNGLNPFDPSDADEDPDGDLLKNLDEFRHGTDPFDPDTDDGGVFDGEEVKRATDPLDPSDDPLDRDGDGLTDKDEVKVFNTDPDNPDTDFGGINDGDEVLKLNTDPLNPNDDGDSDGDGLSDFEETNNYKTDPFDPDTDDGGVDDGSEVNRGTDPLFADDDLIDPRADLEEGIYVIQEECLQCPCPSAIDHTADIIEGDLVFGIISNKDDSEIFSKSNYTKINSIPNNE